MTKPIAPYSPITRAGDLLFVSGQLGMIEGEIVPGGVEAETRQALTNLEAVLAAEGASLSDVVKTTVFMRHMRDYVLMNEVYAEAFGVHLPARSAVAVAELPRLALVEVEAVAYIGHR